ncbi:Ig-like domain-containing protein [Anaerobutyricum hallii]|uniref:Ig-like domain-containing protein n=1 Tax=Anaerobutyricum hallii TaxID=39488 RepID=UPI0026ECDDF9|nr:Ig-like domain-containing protein [Anaerobutyricum hallii]
MKKTKKKGIRSLAILLVLILTLGSSPVTNVEAKAAPRLNYKKVTLVQGKKKRLKVRNLSRRRKVKWYSTKKSVATVNKKGVVKAKKKGKAYIVAKVGKKKYRCKVIVKKKVSKKKKKTKKSKKVKINKSTKRQLPSYKLAFMPEKNYAAGTSLDFFTTVIDHWAKDFSNTSDSVRTKCWRWYSSNKSVISFNSRGIATFKKAGRANVYCKYLTKSGTWIKSSVETIKVFEGGSVKFSYTLGLEDSPFGGEEYPVWDFYKHDTYDTTIPKFNVITLKVQNNSTKAIKLDSELGIDTNTSQPKIVRFSTADKKDVWIPANSEQSVKFYTYYANGSFGKVYYNYIVDKEVLIGVGFNYYYGSTWVGADNNYGSSEWKFYN